MIQLPLFLTGHIVLLGVAKVVLGWPLLLAALFVIGLMLSKGRTPMDTSPLARPSRRIAPARTDRRCANVTPGSQSGPSPRSPCGRTVRIPTRRP